LKEVRSEECRCIGDFVAIDKAAGDLEDLMLLFGQYYDTFEL